MQRLIQGIHRFRSEVFRPRQALFERLADGQSPETLFITCSDSRISPNLLTQTAPGELFILRNAGNIVPPYNPPHGGAAATIEFAVLGLGVQDIVVCGHSHCGAVQALLEPERADNLPALRDWLTHASRTLRIFDKYYRNLPQDPLMTAIEENVLVQLEHLQTHPAVADRLAAGTVALHGWVYKIETGDVFGYDRDEGQFLPLPIPKPSDDSSFDPLVSTDTLAI